MPDTSWRELFDLSKVNEVLDAFSASDILKKLLDGSYTYTFWKPDEMNEVEEDVKNHVRSLELPEPHGSCGPCMSLYRLGSFKANPLLKSQIESIFSDKHTFLLNASGTGKTRLLFEGLCHNWGLYFTASVDTTNLGMPDLMSDIGDRGVLWRKVKSLGEFETKSQSKAANPEALAYNLQLANKHLSALLLSRLLFFKKYLDAVILHGESEEHQETWLKLQLSSLTIDCMLYTEHLSDLLLAAIPEQSGLNDAISGILTEIIAIADNRGIDRVFIVIDEANSAVDILSDAFSEDDCNGVFRHIPTLKILLKTWMFHLQDFPDRFTFVVAGTEIPREPFSDSEWDDWVWSSNTGSFDEEAAQKRWAMSLLPPSVGNTHEGDHFLARVWKWTRGRHRATAALMSVIIEHAFKDLQFLLNSYIYAVTDRYWPYDCDKERAVDLPYGAVSFDILQDDKRLACCVHEVLLSLLLRAKQHPRFQEEDVALVNNAFGRFVDAECKDIAIDEPFLIVGAVKWFTKSAHSLMSYQYFCTHIIHPSITPQHSLAFIALCLAATFDRTQPLKLGALLTLARGSDGLQDLSLHLSSFGPDLVDEPLRYSRRLSTSFMAWSSTPEETISWLKDHPTPFCLHSSETGEMTLIFVVRSTSEERFWVFLRVLPPLSNPQNAGEQARALVDSFHPSSLFRGPTSFDATKALGSLPGLSPAAGESGVLRIIASFDQVVDVSGLDSDGSSPIATLKMKPIRTSTQSWANNTAIADGIMNSIVKSAVEEWPEPEQGVTKCSEEAVDPIDQSPEPMEMPAEDSGSEPRLSKRRRLSSDQERFEEEENRTTRVRN
ncbi:hypothetical protein V5O48_017115 [Marasmius crinis-equi]|uniref:Uncharacterized protein n=1 Tax=Marasmius crinis-equi TaxID=585013 RepID=A0ABR3EPW1_9AGAR